MPDLTRTPSTQERTRVIFVRQPIKDVRREHDRNLLPLRLAIGVIVALGVVGAVWLIGHLGFHLGFASAVAVPDLAAPSGGVLVAGLRLLASLPAAVIASALAQPAWLMFGFLLIAIPAASLAVIGPPQTPGGPRPHILTVVFSFTGAIATGVLALLLVWWTLLPFRLNHLGPMPLEVAAFDGWLAGVRVVTGLDALAVTAAALWMVLIMRLIVPRWLKGLCASAIFAALVIVAVAMSMSAGTLSQMQTPRTVMGDALVVGQMEPGRVVVLRVVDETIVKSIETPRERTAMGEGRSIAAFLR